MKLLDKYLRRDRLKPEEILTDTEDEFSILYLNRHGEPVIMGVNPCQFRFWGDDAESLEQKR